MTKRLSREEDLVTEIAQAEVDYCLGECEKNGCECNDGFENALSDSRRQAIEHFMMVGSGKSVPEHTGEFMIRRTPIFGGDLEEDEE